MTGPTVKRHRSFQAYETPQELIDAIEAWLGPIAWDLAASADNAKAEWWIGEEQDSFTVDWHELQGLLWLNPPFGNIAPWAKKCAEEAELGARIALLVPASVGSCWFAEHVFGRALVLALRPRVSFDGKNPYPKDLMLCVYGHRPGFELWDWKRRIHRLQWPAHHKTRWRYVEMDGAAVQKGPTQ